MKCKIGSSYNGGFYKDGGETIYLYRGENGAYRIILSMQEKNVKDLRIVKLV